MDHVSIPRRLWIFYPVRTHELVNISGKKMWGKATLSKKPKRFNSHWPTCIFIRTLIKFKSKAKRERKKQFRPAGWPVDRTHFFRPYKIGSNSVFDSTARNLKLNPFYPAYHCFPFFFCCRCWKCIFVAVRKFVWHCRISERQIARKRNKWNTEEFEQGDLKRKRDACACVTDNWRPR